MENPVLHDLLDVLLLSARDLQTAHILLLKILDLPIELVELKGRLLGCIAE